MDRRAQGRDAEDRAAQFLAEKGYTIVTRRFSSRRGELDIVALDGDLLVFVEVKHRSERGAAPEEAITTAKVVSLRAAATEYLRVIDDLERDYRLDLIAVDEKGIRHYPGSVGEFD